MLNDYENNVNGFLDEYQVVMDYSGLIPHSKKEYVGLSIASLATGLTGLPFIAIPMIINGRKRIKELKEMEES